MPAVINPLPPESVASGVEATDASVDSGSEVSTERADRAAPPSISTRVSSSRRRSSTYNTVADISLAVGLAGVVAGTVLIIIGAGEDGADTQTARLVPWVSPTAAGAVVGGTF